MHIIENYFDACGFDHRLVQGGTSIYLWNLSRSFAQRGHRVSVVTPAHGQLGHIRSLFDVEELSYRDEHELTIPLDPAAWPGFPESLTWKLRTTAHRVRLDGVDVYLLSNELLDQLSDTFYPPYESKGRDPVFFKPLAFQVDSIRFIRAWFAGERAVVHAHEPYYHYLLPAAFKDDPDKVVVSTVQSNMPIAKMIYRPEVERLLEELDVRVSLPPRQAAHTDPLTVAMSQYQQRTHLHYEYPEDYVEIYALVAEHADLVDFLSTGQLEFYSTFADTPFEQLFAKLPIAGTVARNAHKFFVGGCALGDRWITTDPASVDRGAVLGGLGLDPGLPTFFHNARYALNHKGQLELMRAIDRVLGEGLRANFVIRCLSAHGIAHPYFHEVAGRYAGQVHLEWERVPEERILAYAASSDFCVFPSKFELDTFLIAQGEAMACGAVPIATAQLGMAHFGHVADPVGEHDATGFAVGRSFTEDDPVLVEALADRFRTAVALLAEQPEVYRRLSANAVATARRFSWSRCTDQHLAAFQACYDGERPVLSDDTALARGWFDLLPDSAWHERAAEIADRVIALADLDTYLRVAQLSPDSARRLFDAAYGRADFATCERLAELLPQEEHGAVADQGQVEERAVMTDRNPTEERAAADRSQVDVRAVVDRCRVEVVSGPRPIWRLRYRAPRTRRVQLVRPAPPGAGRGSPEVIDLIPEDGCFTASFDGDRPDDRLHLLLTLTSGRMTWDAVVPCTS
ncbi:glycosyltransferase [Nonomuraea sp. NPDC050153]|uniref:glycosyltransferase n=1 Tax=Nonomuraea sp. NPDC050153 TaxID=3364359 RepID=UPI0037A588E4